MGIGLLLALAIVPVALTLLFAAPFYLTRSSMPAWQALLLRFITFNVVAIFGILGLTYAAFDWFAGLVWFMIKAFLFVFLFVWMRGTLPRVRIDHLMGFAWKWLVEISLLNAFVTAGAILTVQQFTGR
jgi:NADH:ubiquinone oxidoreductase subunit H